VRRLIRCAALIVTVALMTPEVGFAEQPPGMVAASVGAPNTVVWTARAPEIPRIRARPGVMVPTIEAGGRAPRDVSVERPGSSEIKKEDEVEFQAVVDGGAFLLPTWDRGFWLMPPGGLTRFLIPARGFIDPDETLAPGPVISESG